MKKFTEKLAIIPAIIIAGIPFVLLARGLYGIVSPEKTPTAAVLAVQQPEPTSPYELEYCSEEKESIDFIPERITIANAQIDLPIVSVPLQNGTWAVHTGVANYAEGTSTVNINSGNVGIFAHNRKNGFLGIQKVVEGSSIEVYGKGYVATYRVEKTNVTPPTAVDVFYPTDEPTLTLVTCEGTFSQQRYILQAKLVSIKCQN